MSVSRLTGVQLLVFFCSSTPKVFDNPGISKCLNTLCLLSTHLYFIISFIYDLFVALMIHVSVRSPPLGTEQINILTLWKLITKVGIL